MQNHLTGADEADDYTLPILAMLAGAGLALAILTVALPAQARERGYITAKNANLVASINAKLRRYVRPTGKCAGREQLATYYGFESGRRTASGERFHPLGHTAASRTLPFGTTLTVTNPHNDRSVTVRVNDRGPATIASIDLSLGAARALGMTASQYVCVSGG